MDPIFGCPNWLTITKIHLGIDWPSPLKTENWSMIGKKVPCRCRIQVYSNLEQMILMLTNYQELSQIGNDNIY